MQPVSSACDSVAPYLATSPDHVPAATLSDAEPQQPARKRSPKAVDNRWLQRITDLHSLRDAANLSGR